MSSGLAAAPHRHSHSLLVVANCAAVATLLPVSAHQLGALPHLPDPPGSLFDSDQITDSEAAHPFGIPDGILGLASYSATLALVLSAQKSSTARRLLAFKLAGDGALAGFNVVRQVVSFRKLCSWCTATALCTGVMLLAGRRIIAQQSGMEKVWR